MLVIKIQTEIIIEISSNVIVRDIDKYVEIHKSDVIWPFFVNKSQFWLDVYILLLLYCKC